MMNLTHEIRMLRMAFRRVCINAVSGMVDTQLTELEAIAGYEIPPGDAEQLRAAQRAALRSVSYDPWPIGRNFAEQVTGDLWFCVEARYELGDTPEFVMEDLNGRQEEYGLSGLLTFYKPWKGPK